MNNIGIELYESDQQTVTIRRVVRQKVSGKKHKTISYDEPMLEIHCMTNEEYDKFQEVAQSLREELYHSRNRISYKCLLDKIKKWVK